MNHNKYKELLQLYVYDEINDKEKDLLENHLLECSECSEELNSIKHLYTALASNRPAPVSDALLAESRNEFFNSISREKEKISLRERIIKSIEEFLFGGYKVAFGGAATFAIGLVVGYFLFGGSPDISDLSGVDQSINIDQLRKNNVQISDIRFNDPLTTQDEIEFKFNVTKPISYKGNVNDKFAQKLLATALLTADNPGVRIQSVNTIALQNEESFIPDVKVKQALISSLETDQNPGVRRAAINTLLNFPFDQDIRDAFLYVLTHDDNSGIRVAAINGLSALKFSGGKLDEKIRTVLKQNAEHEENNFIRIRAASLLEEE
jgi:hypothetical protein